MTAAPVADAGAQPNETTSSSAEEARRRHHVASACGALLAGILFLWLLTVGTWNPLRYDPSPAAGFSDAQVEAWFDGRWDVPPEEVSIEAFVIGDRHYTYFGPAPALLRVPFLVVSDWFDQRLGGVSLLAAYVVALAGATSLSWRVRCVLRGDLAPFLRTDAVAVFGFMLLLGGGSNIMSLASKAWAYQEAMLWAIAFALWSFRFVVDHLRAPSTRAIALASLFATLSFLSRGSVGVAPVAVLGGIAAIATGQALLGRWERAKPLVDVPARWLRMPPTSAVSTIVAVLAPVAAYAAVNVVKFGSLFRLPIDSQIYINEARPARVAALEANGGSLFGLKFIPTNLLHYLRPDGFDLTRTFPFFTASDSPPTIIGDVVLDGVEPSASVTASMPILFVLAIVGIVVSVRGRALVPDAPGPATFRLLLLGGAAGTVAGLSIAWNTQRYEGDMMPLLIVGGLVGMHHLLARVRPGTSTVARRAARVGVALVALVAAGSIYANLSLGLYYQRIIFPATADTTADFIAFQQDLDERLFPDRPPADVRQGPSLPADASTGELFIIGECDGLYLAGITFGAEAAWKIWRAVERTEATGGITTVLDLPEDPPVGTSEPLLVSGTAGNRSVLALTYLDDGVVRFDLGVEATGEWFEGEEVSWGDHAREVDLVFDARTLLVRAHLDDRIVLATPFWRPEVTEISVGTDGFAPMTSPDFTGQLDVEPDETPICDGILQRLSDG